jgi:hypothetical protein
VIKASSHTIWEPFESTSYWIKIDGTRQEVQAKFKPWLPVDLDFRRLRYDQKLHRDLHTPTPESVTLKRAISPPINSAIKAFTVTGALNLRTYLKSSSASIKQEEPPSRKGDVPRYIYGSKIELGFHIRDLLSANLRIS